VTNVFGANWSALSVSMDTIARMIPEKETSVLHISGQSDQISHVCLS
jgi:hypothetical protein